MDSAGCRRWREEAPDAALLKSYARGQAVVRTEIVPCAAHPNARCVVYTVRWVPNRGRIIVSRQLTMSGARQVWEKDGVPYFTFAWSSHRGVFARVLGRRVFVVLDDWMRGQFCFCLCRSPWALWWGIVVLVLFARSSVAHQLLRWIGPPAAHVSEPATFTHVGQALGRWLLGPPFDQEL